MAKITNAILGNVSGRMGDLIFYQRDGITCIRTLPTSYNDKKSDKQILHRNKIAALGKLYSLFKIALRFDITGKYKNQSSTFYELNWDNISVTLDSVTIDYEHLVLCNQIHLKLLDLKITQTSNNVSFKWEADNVFDNSFLVLCIVFCKGIQQVYVNEVKRNDLSTNIYIPSEAGEIVTYTFTYRRKQ